jgi:4-hydroxy-4-methyl-2-oxoglutarate aldolase
VIVLPRDRVDEVAAAGEARLAKEEGFLERIRAGESTVDLFGLRDRA